MTAPEPSADVQPGHDRYGQCHGDCTVDRGACKGRGRPAAPSEPPAADSPYSDVPPGYYVREDADYGETLVPIPAADSPTPGTETCGRVHRFSPETGWACREEMVNGGRTVCGCGSVFFSHSGPGQWSCVRCGQPPAAPSPVDTTEPPAEAQQDDERAVEIVVNVLLASRQTVVEDWGVSPRQWAQQAVRELAEAGLLASRPSADTETMRRVRDLADELDPLLAAGYDVSGRDLAARIRAALDGDQ